MKLLITTCLLGVFSIGTSFHARQASINGAWHWQNGTEEIAWVFVDGYCVQSKYDKANRKFISTWGGPFTLEKDKIFIQTEFNTANSDMVGKKIQCSFSITDNKLATKIFNEQSQDVELRWTRLDNGAAPLAGNWRISGRLQDGKMVEIQPAARKTLKLLSGTRFQWVAINPELKGFYGTGGGTYTFSNVKYTENIEFFSRDSSRVGASLTFDGKVENGNWHHSGKNSRGEQLNEVWTRVK